MLQLYTDGGVIYKNPSPIGGTWAWVLVDDDRVIGQRANVITPPLMKSDSVTNNQTELLSVIYGLQQIRHFEENLIIYSDSKVTLGRVFGKFPFNNIPEWMTRLLRREQTRLENFRKFKYVHLDGHPTKAQLEQGFGKRGNPVSKYNVLCDQMCHDAGQQYLAQNPRILSTILESEKIKNSL
jgi:ribonuclease HI